MATSDGESSPSLTVDDEPDSVLFEKWAIHFLSEEDVYTAFICCVTHFISLQQYIDDF
jgi:hypothetical protein